MDGTAVPAVRSRSGCLAVLLSATLAAAACLGSPPAGAAEPRPYASADQDSALSLVWDEDPKGTVSGSLNVQGDLASLASTMALRSSRIGGRAAIDFVVGGTAMDPKISGHARIVGGIYEHLMAGTVLRDVVVDASARGGGSAEVGFRGNDGAAGAARGQGLVTLRPNGELGISGTLDLTRMIVVRRDDITVTANGTVKYEGTLNEGLISGRLEASEVTVRLPDPLPPSVAAFDVVEEGPDPRAGEDARGAAADAAASPPWVGTLDLTVKMPGNVFVRGRGLDSQWSGLVRVTGTTVSPRLLGRLRATRGRLVFADREFVLGEGSMEFTGTDGIDPLVDLSARSAISDVTAILRVTGWASKPAIALTSDPELPEDEILARIMFEKSVSRLTSGEALRLAEALKMLAWGESPTVGLAAFTDRMLGVDVLAMERQRRLAGDARSRRGPGRWDEEQLGAKTLEIEITPNISVAGESENDDDNLERSKLGVIWKWDY